MPSVDSTTTTRSSTALRKAFRSFLRSLFRQDLHEHPLAVDVFHLEVAQLRPAHAGRVERHQHGAVKQIAGAVDESHRFFLAEDNR